MAELEFDPDMDLSEQISSYSENDLKQLEKITLEIIKHWEDMLKVAGGRMNEGTKMAVDLSIEQAKKDLSLIHKKNETVCVSHRSSQWTNT